MDAKSSKPGSVVYLERGTCPAVACNANAIDDDDITSHGSLNEIEASEAQTSKQVIVANSFLHLELNIPVKIFLQ